MDGFTAHKFICVKHITCMHSVCGPWYCTIHIDKRDDKKGHHFSCGISITSGHYGGILHLPNYEGVK